MSKKNNNNQNPLGGTPNWENVNVNSEERALGGNDQNGSNEEYEIQNDPYSLQGDAEQSQSAFAGLGGQNGPQPDPSYSSYEQPQPNQGFGGYNQQQGYNQGYYNTIMSQQQWADSTKTEVARFLDNNRVFELTIGISKADLLTFADNALPIVKRTYYVEMKENVFTELLKGIDIVQFQNAKRTYFPSTNNATMAKEGTHTIIAMSVTDQTLRQGLGEVRNVVDLARQTSNFEVQRILNKLDTSKLFSPYITVPHKKYENIGETEIYVNTSVVLLSFLGLSLEGIQDKFFFTVKETNDMFIVNLKKMA